MAAEQGRFELPRALRRFRRLGYLRGGGARLTRYWADVLDSDPIGGRAVMVCEVVIGDLRIRAATEPVHSVSGTDGSVHSTVATMIDEPEIKHAYALGEATSQVRSVAMTFDAAAVDPAGLIAQGLPLTGYGEVSLELVDGDHDRRYVVLQGELSGGVAFGAVTDRNAREVIEFEIADPKAIMDVRFPLWVVDDVRYGSFSPHPTAIGQRLPVVFNGYEKIPAVRVDDVSGARQFAFAYRHGWDTSDASVFVNGELKSPGDATYGHVFSEVFDDEGVPLTVVEFSVGATTWEDGDAVHVSISRDDERLSVIEVIRQVCEAHTPLGSGGINAALFNRANALLGGFVPEVVVNGGDASNDAGALQWIEETLLAQFPMISMVWDLGGYGPIVTDRTADTVANLVVGSFPLFDRTSLVQERDKAELFNEFVLRYDYDPILDVYKAVSSRSPLNSAMCATSERLLGSRHHPVIEAPYIRTTELARWVLNWLVEHLTLPSYFVQYEGAGALFWQLRRGDNVLLTDSDFGWSELVATVEEISYRRGRVELGLRVWANPIFVGGAARNIDPPV